MAKNRGRYFPTLDRKFAVVWREILSIALARYTARAAFKAAYDHRAALN